MCGSVMRPIVICPKFILIRLLYGSPNSIETHLPLELWPSCRSGLGAKSEPMPDDPLDRVVLFICCLCVADDVAAAAATAAVVGPPTINLFRQRRNSVAAKFPFDR